MAKNDRSLPLRMQITKSIERRIPKSHPRRRFIKDEIGRQEAGYNGEINLDYYIGLIPNKDFIVLKGLELSIGSQQFQIDNLLIFGNFILNIEAKNYSGDLYLNSSLKQMHRTLNNKVEIFPNPITQVEIQNLKLTKWLSTHFLPNMHIEHLVFLSNPRTTIRADAKSSHLLNRFCNGNTILEKIEQIKSSMVNQKTLPQHELNKLRKKLIKLQSPPSLSLMRTYKIDPREIPSGVQCPLCLHLPMERRHGTWYCSECQISS